jgi:anaerobic selenocysteine-containing dehydrogenase
MSWETERTDINVYSQGDIDKWVYSTCNICSIGCGCYIAVKDEKIVGIKGNSAHPINRGRLGPKGENQWYANNSPDRLFTPMIRDSSGKLVPATWDEAMNLMVKKATDSLKQRGSNSIAIYSTEEQIDMMEMGQIGFFWNIGTNPMVSLPNRRRAKAAFEKTFVVVQDPFLTETATVADVVLPTALWGEKEGVNGEYRANDKFIKKSRQPTGRSKN